jgi:diguanylate cyclase
LPGTNAFGAKLAAERIRKFLAGLQMEGPQGPFSITVSFGVACVCGPGCGGQAKQIIALADEALYAAKAGGRNRVVMHGEPTT